MAESQPIYVASRASIPERGRMWRGLRAQGIRITSSWIDEDGEGQTGDFGELWLRIVNEIRDAVALVLYAKAADFPLKGALTEAGLALGMGKPVIVCLPDLGVLPRNYRPIGSWIAHPLVTRCDDVKAAVQLAASSRVSASVAPSSLIEAFKDTAIKAHIGFKHEGPWEECEWIECEDRREMIDSLSVAAVVNETSLSKYVLAFCPERGRGNAILSVEGELTLLGKNLVRGLAARFAFATGKFPDPRHWQPVSEPAPASTAAPKSLLREPVKVDTSSPLVVTRNGVPCPDQEAALEEFKEACRARAEQLDKAEADRPVAEPRYGERSCNHCGKPIKNTPRRPNRWTHTDTASIFCETATTPPSTRAKAVEIDVERVVEDLAHNPQVCVCKPFCVHWEIHAKRVIERCFSSVDQLTEKGSE